MKNSHGVFIARIKCKVIPGWLGRRSTPDALFQTRLTSFQDHVTIHIT